MDNKKGIYIKLSEEDITFLVQKLGGKTKGIEKLIKDQINRTEKGSNEKGIEERFFGMVILPADGNLSETYQTFLNSYIENEGRMGVIDYYAPKISSLTGIDEKTIRKHFRKLAGSKYIKSKELLFRPTLRLKPNVDRENFRATFIEYSNFLGGKDEYEDIGADIWRS